MKKLIIILCLIASISLIAQDCNNLIKYTDAIEKADSCIFIDNYQKAQNYYNAAEIYCRDSSENIKNAKDALFNKINQLRIETDSLRIQTEATLLKVKQEQAKNKKIIDAFYFYENKFALAYKNNQYGFIDKQGNTVIEHKYDMLLPFNESGFAIARKDSSFQKFKSFSKKTILVQKNYFI